MKTPFDPRHRKRRQLIQSLFAWGFQPTAVPGRQTNQIIEHLPEIDSLITACAPQWPIDQINRIDLAILRLALYELAVSKQEPEKVIIDEAVELAKEFGGESSPAFVNGVLGNVVKQQLSL